MFNELVVLWVLVMVFCGFESVSDFFDVIYNRIGKIISGVYFVEKIMWLLVYKKGFLLVLIVCFFLR